MNRSQRLERVAVLRLLAPAALAACLLSAPPAVRAAGEATFAEYQVKAAFLKNFVKFVAWPSSTGAFNVCILGDDPFKGWLAGTEDAGSGRRLAHRRIATVHETDGCQVLFVPAGQRAAIPGILATLDGKPVLTVGDGEGMAAEGLMLSFLIEEQKVRFEVNLAAIRRAGLTVSSRLLGLAKTVHGPR